MATAVSFPVDAGISRSPAPRVAVLEPNKALLNYIGTSLEERYAVQLFSDESTLQSALNRDQQPDIFLVAWDSAEQALPIVTDLLDRLPEVPIVLMSCTSELSGLAQAISMGTKGLILKPFSGSDLEAVVEKHVNQKNESATPPVACAATEVEIGDGRSFVRSSAQMQQIESQASLVAPSDIPVLILGESGTGKEVIAMYVHRTSNRSRNMFLKVNCAAMPADLLESELFGYEQGAFTGAVKAKPGKFEICDGGTIFLDEIGEMPAQLQAKLLHVLQDGTFSRLGSRAPIKTDVRVIAATNINMKEAMANRQFREDLYYRLNGFTLRLPPLRERTEEILPLAQYFMRRSAEKYQRSALPFSPRLIRAMEQYNWPGNLRELENVVNRYLIMEDERSILAELMPSPASSASPSSTRIAIAAEPLDGDGLKQIVRSLKGDAEAAAISSALEETRWNRRRAAEQLKISYKALLYKIRNYNLTAAARR